MTQPSLNTTFDTSLIDLCDPRIDQFTGSFSTTDTDPSDSGIQTQKTDDPSLTIPTMSAEDRTPKASQDTATPAGSASSSTARIVRHMDTTSAYDAWASVYDTDGNILQRVDDLELETLLPEFLAEVEKNFESAGALRIVDLGCGTGRNTAKLLQYPWNTSSASIEVIGVDASPGMLSLARKKLAPRAEVQLRVLQHDMLWPADGESSPDPLPTQGSGVISTLVLEHIPLATFFNTLSSTLLPAGLALITNMHPDMGAQSQAGFVMTDQDGKKIKVRGKSYVYGIEETVEAARNAGFDVVGEVRERSITEEMVREGVIGERGWKWVGVNVWFGLVLRKKQ